MTRAGSIFAIGMFGVVPFGVISIAITTRYLEPTDFGRLAVLMALSSILTIFCGLGFLQGTLMSAYGMIGDEEGDEMGDSARLDADVSEALRTKTASDISAEKRRILGSGLLVVTVLSSLLCGAVALLAPPISTLLPDGTASSVQWMAACAWTGGIWRMLHQIPRMERLAGMWSVLQWLRPGLVVGLTTVALIIGLGINGVLMATAGGTALALIIALVAVRRCLSFSFRRADIGQIWGEGRRWIPLNIAAGVQANVSILLLGVLATPTSVGLFQVANRIAQLPTYFGEGFLLGWPSMEKSPISLAAKEKKGTRPYAASVFTLFYLSILLLLLSVCLLADALVHIAAPSYRSAAALIPIVAAAYGAQQVFRGIFRATAFPHRRYWFTLLHLVWIAPFAGVTALLVPISPSYGVAIGQLVAAATISVCFAALDRRWQEATPFEWRRLGKATVIAIVCVVFVEMFPVHTALRAVLSVGVLLAFPLLLLLFRVLSPADINTARTISTALIPLRWRSGGLRQRFDRLSALERGTLLAVANGRDTIDQCAQSIGVARPVLFARVTRVLRHCIGDHTSTPNDHLMGEYLLHDGPTLERDIMAIELRNQGVDPLQLHLLEEALRALSTDRRFWRRRPTTPERSALYGT